MGVLGNLGKRALDAWSKNASRSMLRMGQLSLPKLDRLDNGASRSETKEVGARAQKNMGRLWPPY